ncbi:thiolase family protein [Caldilinea sp.]|mgnify:CR=1 FL=1|uniref:thiolase family protein n=1 Tax=Caldilinea sp. TaxID=2293560 RepID=UPI0021DE8CA0|nr:thiolase family protein [Caldilinea sp.]GIV70600.1 MAG: acetyl-CoA acetyltransferase [Caldilinea sp.]
MSETYIVSAVRTAIGKFGGALKDVSPVDLCAHVMKAAIDRAAIDAADLDLYIFGNILKHGHGQLVPRHAAFKAGIPAEVDGYAVDMLCSSGMMSVMNGDAAIRAGDADLVLVGGVESMSQAGFVLSARARWGYKLLIGDNVERLQDAMLVDGLTDPLTGELMGEETERLCAVHGVTRAELDEVACLSHARAAEARASGKFADEIAPYAIQERKRTVLFAEDEGIRSDTTMETLAALRPAFAREGVLTAGNSSQISDGAAALVLASPRAVQRYDLKPIARILGGAWAGVDSWRFVEGPAPAIRKLLRKLDASLDSFDLIENNEAFALNNVLLRRLLEIPYEKMNVHGGAIALGHPIGASGARILVTLVHALRAHGKPRGLATLCHGVGGATALAVELCEK